jgi:YidC/Oxa1 family membrane protein insertase
MIGDLFNVLIFQPLLNALVFLYEHTGNDLGVAIILLTLLIRTVLFPLFQKSARHQAIVQRLRPEIDRINRIHKDDKQKQAEATMALWKEHDANPFFGFFFLFIQLPLLIGLYRIFLTSISADTLTGLYSFIPDPGKLNPLFLGLISLTGRNIIIVVLAGIAQFFQGKLSLAAAPPMGNTPMERMGRQMVFVAPALTIVLFLNFPAAIALYWLVSSLFSIGQQLIINRQLAVERTPHHGLERLSQKPH